jgi:hypothetical protein
VRAGGGRRGVGETCRRLACDSTVRVVTHGKGGAVEDVGRRSRKIPLALRSLPAHLRLVSADTAVCLVLAAYGNLTSEGTLW